VGVSWAKGTIYDNIDVIANSLGYENASIVMQLAMVPWDSPEERDAFIASVIDSAPQGGTSKIKTKRRAGK
jgi:hypothetical protein